MKVEKKSELIGRGGGASIVALWVKEVNEQVKKLYNIENVLVVHP
jgi:hypothetical protein